MSEPKLFRHPPLILAFGFLVLIIVGTVLLKLPGFTYVPISWREAAFMATSAVTVTGLTVVELSYFTNAGQLTLALLIEAGGLGFMSFAVLGSMVLQRRFGMTGQLVAKEAFGGIKLSEINQMTRSVLGMALVAQSIGWVLLTFVWTSDYGLSSAAYRAFFYTISAFNNAGFAFSGENLIPYVHDTAVILIISLLAIVGGLGFFVIKDIIETRRFSALCINTKVILIATLCLNLFAFVIFWLLERHNPMTLGNLPLAEQFSNAWLQAVTPRTAGFSSVPTQELSDSSTLLTMLLMQIGGGSYSTAGGMKIGTIVVLIFATITYLRQRDSVTLMRRTVPDRQVKRAMAMLCITLVLIFTSIFVLSMIEKHHDLVDVLFEVVSALSNVGLSRGMTNSLSPLGEAVLMFMMFAGRIGPLSIAYMIALPKATNVKYPETQIHVG